jgi:hypothetical protein
MDQVLSRSCVGPVLTVCVLSCRTVFVLSEVLDEQLKALWFSPFHTDDMEAELDMVRHLCVI